MHDVAMVAMRAWGFSLRQFFSRFSLAAFFLNSFLRLPSPSPATPWAFFEMNPTIADNYLRVFNTPIRRQSFRPSEVYLLDAHVLLSCNIPNRFTKVHDFPSSYLSCLKSSAGLDPTSTFNKAMPSAVLTRVVN